MISLLFLRVFDSTYCLFLGGFKEEELDVCVLPHHPTNDRKESVNDIVRITSKTKRNKERKAFFVSIPILPLVLYQPYLRPLK